MPQRPAYKPETEPESSLIAPETVDVEPSEVEVAEPPERAAVDEPEDEALELWAGVVPVFSSLGAPESDPGVRPGLGIPDHIAHRSW